MSIPDREQLIEQIADRLHEADHLEDVECGNCTMAFPGVERIIRLALSELDRLGFSIITTGDAQIAERVRACSTASDRLFFNDSGMVLAPTPDILVGFTRPLDLLVYLRRGEPAGGAASERTNPFQARGAGGKDHP